MVATDIRGRDGRLMQEDAIYAGMAWLRAFVEDPANKTELERWRQQAQAVIDTCRLSVSSPLPETRYGSRQAIPWPRTIPEHLCDAIYPGEPESVRLGIRSALMILYGVMTIDECDCEAQRRFLRERFN